MTRGWERNGNCLVGCVCVCAGGGGWGVVKVVQYIHVLGMYDC